jgi:hypothetical protein
MKTTLIEEIKINYNVSAMACYVSLKTKGGGEIREK